VTATLASDGSKQGEVSENKGYRSFLSGRLAARRRAFSVLFDKARSSDSGKSHRQGAALSDNAGFFKTEIAAAARGGHTDDDVIHQLEPKDSAGFENSPGEADIGFARAWFSRYAACGITGVIPHPVLCRI
jgi:hypothetical protein